MIAWCTRKLFMTAPTTAPPSCSIFRARIVDKPPDEDFLRSMSCFPQAAHTVCGDLCLGGLMIGQTV